MTGTERREAILKALRESDKPLSGSALAKEAGVSRQVVVQDIALLRSAGYDVMSTNRGYILGDVRDTDERPSRLIKVRHTPQQTEAELNAIVDLGGKVKTVMVNHRTYGRVEAELGIGSRRDVQRFLADLRSGISSPLMTITDGYHFHEVTAPSIEILDEIETALGKLGFLAELTDYEREVF